MPALSTVTTAYLGALDAPPATTRQRRWALADLAAFAAAHLGHPDPPAAAVLTPPVLSAWLAPGTSVATTRAKASAVRALTTFAAAHQLLPPAPDLDAVLRRPAPAPPAPNHSAGRLLLTAAAHDAPWGVPAPIWTRFAAHVHLLAATGATEAALAGAALDDLTGANTTLTLPGADPCPLPIRTRAALTDWLAVRAGAAATLQGSDPRALWLRLHPGTDRRTGRIAPAGLPISARGLRLSFTVVRDTLAATDPRLTDVSVKDVRALGRTP